MKHADNKGRRQELTMLKYRKRLKKWGRKPGEFLALKSHGKPCSCWMCRGERYSRKTKHKSNYLKEAA